MNVQIVFHAREPPKGDYKREFDAKIIEYWVSKEWHEGRRDPFEIIQAINLELKHFVKKLENSFARARG